MGAIAQAQRYLKKKAQSEIHLMSIPLVNYYLSAQDWNGELYSVKNPEERKNFSMLPDSLPRFTIGDYSKFLPREPDHHKTFYHNPYVNRMWAEIELYRY